MSAPLHSVRAGRSVRREGTKIVDAQPQRGLLYLTEEDGLTHFCWKDGQSNETVEDLILFPGDASFRPLAQSARTCALRFSSSDAVHFFWFQDPDASTDAQHISTINQLLQAPDDATEEDVHMSGSSSPPQPRSDQDQLAALLQAFGGNSASSNAPAASHYGDVPYTLPDIATPSSLAPLLSNPAVRQRLAQHLPPGLDNSQETLQSVVHSPELRRSLAGLDQALRTGALGPLVQSLGLKPDAALSVDSFLQAIQDKADAEKNSDMDTS